MADQEVRSPHSLTNDEPHPRRGDALTQARVYRGDSDHAASWKPRADQNSPVHGQPVGVMQDKGRRR